MMYAAKDIMTKNVICIHKDTPIFEAIDLMIINHITGVPVVDNNKNLVGILTEQDVLRLYYKNEEKINKTVSDFMTQPAIHFDEDEYVQDICDCLRDNSIRRVPITSNGKVVGIISRSEIMKLIIRQWNTDDSISNHNMIYDRQAS